MNIKSLILNLKPIKFYNKGVFFFNDPHYIEIQKRNKLEFSKKPTRTDVINYLLSLSNSDTCYLEIGVRNPEHNFNQIKANKKYSVDPCIEFETNLIDFKITSDDFFLKLSNNELLNNKIKFDVIFIDGLHLAEQVHRDIQNAIQYIKDDGFIVLHDCNPPSEWHAREFFNYTNTPAGVHWNGTTWKAFLLWRFNPTINSCCIDCDWGVGILSKNCQIGKSINTTNSFFEYNILDKNRKEHLNLIDFDTLKSRLVN